jgi:hypothetical protein
MTTGSPDSATAKDDNALRDAVGWLTTVGGMLVFVKPAERPGEVHVYRGRIHTTTPLDRDAADPIAAGAQAVLTAIRQARKAHETSA